MDLKTYKNRLSAYRKWTEQINKVKKLDEEYPALYFTRMEIETAGGFNILFSFLINNKVEIVDIDID